eukprot:326357-Pyramimonas_sp.AAC.1
MPLKALMAAPCSSFTTFDQCEFGQIGRAPTAPLGIRLSELPTLLRDTPGGGYCSHGPKAHETMVGWDSNLKRWRTAPKKVYPPALCQVLASSMLKALLPSLLGQSPVLGQANEEAEVQELHRFFVDSSNIALNAPFMGPDFAGGTKPPRPPSAFARISATLEEDGFARFPSEEEEIEGTHSVAMAHLDADETAVAAFGACPP